MKSFCAKLSFNTTNAKIGQQILKPRGGVKMTPPPLGLRVTIFSLGLLGLRAFQALHVDEKIYI